MELPVVTTAVSSKASLPLQAWAARAGIGREVDGLLAVLEETKLLLAVAGGKTELQNKALERFMKEVDYEAFNAETLIDELEYRRIRDEVEEEAEDCDDDARKMQDSDNGHHSDVRTNYVLKESSSSDKQASDSSELRVMIYKKNEKQLISQVELDKDDILSQISHHVNYLRQMQHDARKALKLEELDFLALTMKPADADLRETTPLVTEPRIYGREKERDQMASKLMSPEVSDEDLTVLAIVGNGGVGKTTLARMLYNDAIITKHFQLRVWIYASVNFDEIKLTHDLLECLHGQRFGETKDLNELQQSVEDAVKFKRLLLVIDDIWEDHNTTRWDTFLAPLRQTQVKGNKILVTTRKLSVAKMTGAKDSMKLDGLLEADFWSLFKECSFGNEIQLPKLLRIGRQVAKKLKGYPLAAKTVGTLLRRKLDIDHWMRVLDSDEWRHQHGSEDIIPALKISYNHLPLHLQHCFSYCALFPKHYHFNPEEMVNIWTAQGFICPMEMKRIEDIGIEYFNELMHCGFIQYEAPRLAYIMHDLIHDLAQMVSSEECFTIQAPGQSTKSRFIRHVSVITESMYRSKGDGSMQPNEYFKQEFAKSINMVRTKNLGTIMLFGRYDSSFCDVFRHELTEFKTVRVLKLEMMFDSLGSLICNIAAFTHLRYLELRASYSYSSLQLPEAISNLYCLEVLDIRHNWGIHTKLPRGISNLVNLRHFLAIEKLHEKIIGVGKLKYLQELKAFKVKKRNGFNIDQLGYLMELRGTLKIYSIGNVNSKEASMAKLIDKVNLRSLQLSWGKEKRDKIADTLVLEELQPYASLESLRIDGHRGKISTWLTTDYSLTKLQSLHIENCLYWTTIPPMEKLSFLKELHLIRILKIQELVLRPLEVLELREMPSLTQCTVLKELNQDKSIRVLEIVSCYQLEKLPFLHSFSDIDNEQQLLNLERVQINECPKSADLPPFPVNKKTIYMDISDAGSVRSMSFHLKEVIGSDGLHITIIGGPYLRDLNENILAFHNLSALEEMEITNSPELTNLAWNRLQQHVFLKKFAISSCPQVFHSLPTGYSLPPSVQDLNLSMCNITGNQLTQLLRNLPNLLNLEIAYCPKVTSLAVGLSSSGTHQIPEGLCQIPAHCFMSMKLLHIASDMTLFNETGLGQLNFLKQLTIRGCTILLKSMVGLGQAGIQSNETSFLPSSLNHLRINALPDNVFQHSNLTSLIHLDLEHSPNLQSLYLHSCKILSKLVIKDCNVLTTCEGLQNLIFLTKMVVKNCPSLVSLPLHACQALQDLQVEDCNALDTLESLVSLPLLSELHLLRNQNLVSFKLHPQAALLSLNIQDSPALTSWGDLKSLSNLNHMEIRKAPGFVSTWNYVAREADLADQKFYSPLKSLYIDDISFLTNQVCGLIPSLKTLSIGFHKDSRDVDYKVCGFTSEQQCSLKLLKQLECLEFVSLANLQVLPAELHCCPSLQHLIIWNCRSIKSLPEEGLPSSLKLLDVDSCSAELYDQCRYVSGLQRLYISGRKVDNCNSS